MSGNGYGEADRAGVADRAGGADVADGAGGADRADVAGRADRADVAGRAGGADRADVADRAGGADTKPMPSSGATNACTNEPAADTATTDIGCITIGILAELCSAAEEFDRLMRTFPAFLAALGTSPVSLGRPKSVPAVTDGATPWPPCSVWSLLVPLDRGRTVSPARAKLPMHLVPLNGPCILRRAFLAPIAVTLLTFLLGTVRLRPVDKLLVTAGPGWFPIGVLLSGQLTELNHDGSILLDKLLNKPRCTSLSGVLCVAEALSRKSAAEPIWPVSPRGEAGDEADDAAGRAGDAFSLTANWSPMTSLASRNSAAEPSSTLSSIDTCRSTVESVSTRSAIDTGHVLTTVRPMTAGRRRTPQDTFL